MKITLSISEPYKLNLSRDELDKQEQIIREKFKACGLTLDSRTAHGIYFADDAATAQSQVRPRTKAVRAKWSKGDLAFVDYEPPHYYHDDEYHPEFARTTASLIKQAKRRTPGRNNVGLYGLPRSQWWHPFGRETSEFGLEQTHRRSKIDWFGPELYQEYNIGEVTGLDHLRQLLQIKNTCERVDPSVPIHPFVQPVIRHKDHDYQEMTDETIYAVWSSLAWAGLTEPIWWFESGKRNEQFDKHLDRIERHAPIMLQAIADTQPGTT